MLEDENLTLLLSLEPTRPLATQVEEMLDISSDDLDTTPLRSALVEGGEEMQVVFAKSRHRLKVCELSV